MPVLNITKKRGLKKYSTPEKKGTWKKSTLHNILLYKPFDVLCQFTDTTGRITLSAFGPFPTDVYPAGRLDADSEGLVLLTNDGTLKHLLLEPTYRHPRTYLVQVERIPSEAALNRLRDGVEIEHQKTLPVEIELLTHEPELPERSVPIRFRKNVPTAWLKMTLREGRNRQVRKMTAAAGHPTLRLVRIAIANLTLDGLEPGEHRTITNEELRELKKILGLENTSRKNPPRRPF
ncbi:MAG: pseudouridine synthase [Bacteroidetes bacterium]|nr:MAG: pseudouridine synthase [Bacteroidota bacterium]